MSQATENYLTNTVLSVDRVSLKKDFVDIMYFLKQYDLTIFLFVCIMLATSVLI